MTTTFEWAIVSNLNINHNIYNIVERPELLLLHISTSIAYMLIWQHLSLDACHGMCKSESPLLAYDNYIGKWKVLCYEEQEPWDQVPNKGN